MIFRVSSATERVVGRLDTGEDLVHTLTEICRDRSLAAGQIRAVGHFDEIELVHFNTTTQSYETLVDGRGSFDLVSLDGNISRLGGEVALRLAAVFNVIGPLGPQMVGGQLRKARAQSAEFVIESYTDLEMERRLDPETGRLVLGGIERKPGASAAPTPSAPQPASDVEVEDDQNDQDDGPSMSWDEAIAEVEEKEKRRDKKKRGATPGRSRRVGKAAKKKSSDPYADLDLDEPLLSAGDLLDHPKLGRCRVLDVDEGEAVRIRLPRGRIRKLTLSVLEIEYKGKEGGKNLFEARVRR